MNVLKLKQLIETFLAEDLGEGDLSTAIFTAHESGTAHFIAKSDGIIAGMDTIQCAYHLLEPSIHVTHHVRDGDVVVTGQRLATVRGACRHLLSGERVIINLLQHLSGIATLTNQVIEHLQDPSIQICDTRKTTPGLRMLEKYAVRCGGGVNHRMGLYDGVMLKDNHIAASGGVAQAVQRIKHTLGPMTKIEVEIESEAELVEAIEAGADVIMFDNRSPEDIRAWMHHVPQTMITEASGSIDLDNIHRYRGCGVQYISLGFITHSAPAFDISLNIEGGKKMNLLDIVEKHTAPEHYRQMSTEEMKQRIRNIKRKMRERLYIPGHHYQKDDVIEFADDRGDSLQLAQLAAQNQSADYIVFCGVHFMAETADILTESRQTVILPDMRAGCSMADMADIDQTERAWKIIQDVFGDTVLPLTYVNSTAAIKAFCGKHGGATVTSSNAKKMLEWALTHKERLLFLPDQHLGRNTAYELGIPLEEMVVWDPINGTFESETDDLQHIKVILWKGHCSVHEKFTVENIEQVRQEDPDIRIIVHPECSHEVVREADVSGSTNKIIQTLAQAPQGSKWAVGTEMNLVNRLAHQHKDKSIRSLNPNMCPCLTMNRIDLPYLTWVLEALQDGQIINPIRVDADTAAWARLALQRMLNRA